MKQRYYRRLTIQYFLFLAAGLALALCAVCAFFYVADPLQFFHRSWFLPASMLSANMREQAIGMINIYDFDSAILGTSMLENTSAAEASSKLGGRFINISTRATNLYERHIILKKLLSRKPEKILYSLDHFFLDYELLAHPDASYAWASLYGANPFRYFLYYLTRDNIANLARPYRNLASVDPDRPAAWKDQPEFYTGFGGLQNWIANIDELHMRQTLQKDVLDEIGKHGQQAPEPEHDAERERLIREHLDEYLLNYARQNPDTTFYLFFPPYYRLTYATWLRFSAWRYPAYLATIRYLVEEAAKLPNLHIYGLEDQDFPDAIGNYADRYHYHPRYNSLMLDAIASGQELKPENLEQYLTAIFAKARAFDLDKFVKDAAGMIEARRAAEKSE